MAYHPNAPTPTNRPASSSTPRPAAVPAPKPSKLAGLTASALPNARRFFIYGVRKWGKSTWAADAPRPIFIDTKNDTEHLHVARYPAPDGGWSWQGILDAIDDLLANKHDYASLVIEDVGDLEMLIWRHMFATVPISDKEGPAVNIESYGYGKGYKIANQFWRILSARLDDLRLKKGMNIILLGHSAIVTQKNPAGPDYETFQPTIYKEAAGILGADCDVIGFAAFNDSTTGAGDGGGKGKKPKKVIGATGDRIVRLEYNVAWPMVGSRLPLGGDVDIEPEHPFGPFARAMAQVNMSPAMLMRQVVVELDRLGEAFVDHKGAEVETSRIRTVAESAAAAGDHDKLNRFLNLLRQAQPATVQIQETTP